MGPAKPDRSLPVQRGRPHGAHAHPGRSARRHNAASWPACRSASRSSLGDDCATIVHAAPKTRSAQPAPAISRIAKMRRMLRKPFTARSACWATRTTRGFAARSAWRERPAELGDDRCVRGRAARRELRVRHRAADPQPWQGRPATRWRPARFLRNSGCHYARSLCAVSRTISRPLNHTSAAGSSARRTSC